MSWAHSKCSLSTLLLPVNQVLGFLSANTWDSPEPSFPGTSDKKGTPSPFWHYKHVFSMHISHCLIDTPSDNSTDLSGLSCPNQKSSSFLSCLPPLPVTFFFFF